MEKPASRRGLVLAGGGAKGAYAFGCLKAFRDKSIHFEYVAGTSVGALNAVIWSSNQFELGEQIWNGLSFDSVYPVVIPTAKRWPRWSVWLLCIIHAAVRALWNVLHGVTIDPERSVHVRVAATIKVVCTTLVLGGSSILGYRLCMLSAPWWFWLIWILLTAGAVSELWRFATSLRSCDQNGLGRFYALLFDAITMVSLWLLYFRHRWPFVTWNGPMPLFLATLAGWSAAYVARTLMKWIATMLLDGRISVLSRAPLTDKLKQILSNRLETPVFVTVATKVDILDSAAPWKSTSFLRPDWADSGRKHAPVRTCWIPNYVLLNDIKDNLRLRLDYCLASAALPFGIVPPIEILGRSYVDGGLADNCPAHPLLDRELDELFVVLLEPLKDLCKKEAGHVIEETAEKANERAAAEIGVSADRWADRMRVVFLAFMGIPETEDRAREFIRALTLFQYKGKLPRVKFFHPDDSLGDLLKGTLRFESEYARGLIVKGEEDTKRRLLEP